jgi:pteridine reductase
VNHKKTQAKGVALITGAARRIGSAIASALHEANFDVVIHCHQSVDEANALADSLNAKRVDSAYVYSADLSNKLAAEGLIQAVVAWKNRLDILINNASNFIKTPMDGFDEASWDYLWDLNTKAPFWLSQAAHEYLMQSNHANIINITDIHAEKPLRDYCVYSQTKAALKMQTEALAREYAPHIRVNAVAPGAIIEPEGENSLSVASQQKILKKVPLGHWGAPSFVAAAVSSLVFNDYITGQTIRVDGGRSLT